MTIRDLLHGISAEIYCDADAAVTGIVNDSRRVEAGSLFVAVSGYADDGLHYAAAAVTNGAVAVVCDRKPDADIPHILVPDARLALSHIAASFYGHPTSRMSIVGVTGTNGKTTTTHLIKHIIERCLNTPCGLIGGNGIDVGGVIYEALRTTPEAHELQHCFAEMLQNGVTYAVMEVSSHALCLGRVADVEFNVGVFTNLTQDHLDFHKDMDDYFAAKMRLLERAEHRVVNLDDPRAAAAVAASGGSAATFSITSNSATYVAKNIRLFADRVEFELLHTGLDRVVLRIPGAFSVSNALAAIGACASLGIAPSDAARALRDCPPVMGRMETVKLPESCGYSVIIDYACTPDALEQVLSSLRTAATGRLVCLFGCGGDRDKGKRPQMGAIAESLADFVYVTSDNPRTEEPDAIIADILAGMKKERKRAVNPDRREAIHKALSQAQSGDIIVLCGKGQETYQEIHGVKRHMDEREIVAEFYKD